MLSTDVSTTASPALLHLRMHALKLIYDVYGAHLYVTWVTGCGVYQSVWTDYVDVIINSLIRARTCDVLPIIITEAITL